MAEIEPLRLGERRKAELMPRAPAALGQPGGDILAAAHRLADLAHGAAGVLADDGGADGGPLAAVAVLDHLLTPLVLEVDVG